MAKVGRMSGICLPRRPHGPRQNRPSPVVGAGARFTGKQALSYTPGISTESADARGIHLQIVTIPPGRRAKAHRHVAHETATMC
jgi:uncharacterized RmlC-like cupin family protein